MSGNLKESQHNKTNICTQGMLYWHVYADILYQSPSSMGTRYTGEPMLCTSLVTPPSGAKQTILITVQFRSYNRVCTLGCSWHSCTSALLHTPDQQSYVAKDFCAGTTWVGKQLLTERQSK